jgi:hypothetical protein
MFRTRTAALNSDRQLTAASMHHRARRSQPRDMVRLQWRVRNGRLISRWRREPHDLTEGRARLTGCAA